MFNVVAKNYDRLNKRHISLALVGCILHALTFGSHLGWDSVRILKFFAQINLR